MIILGQTLLCSYLNNKPNLTIAINLIRYVKLHIPATDAFQVVIVDLLLINQLFAQYTLESTHVIKRILIFFKTLLRFNILTFLELVVLF